MKEYIGFALVLGFVIGYFFSQYTLSPVAKFAQQEADNDRLILNEGWLFSEEERLAFKPAIPQYLERDFEAGANYICDLFLIKTNKDFCHTIIKWR